MRNESCDTAPTWWARETGPDIPNAARLVLVYLAGLCDPETGTVGIAHRSVARHFRRNLTWPVGIFEELKAAGLVLADRDREWDGRRNVYTLAGAGSAWVVTIPFVPYCRHEFYALQHRIAELERLPAVNPEGATGRQDDRDGRFSSTDPPVEGRP